MANHITIQGRGGAFGAYIARPKTLPAPAVVVLQELFGVNADIRKTCDELAEQGFVAVAPTAFAFIKRMIVTLAPEIFATPWKLSPNCLIARARLASRAIVSVP